MRACDSRDYPAYFYSTGGGVISKAMFHYGYFESQIQMNSGQGWHSSFWLMAGKYVFHDYSKLLAHVQMD